MSNGGGVVYAIAGVLPKVSEAEYGLMSLMPLNRFVAVRGFAPAENINPYQKNKHDISNLRDAVRALMVGCDKHDDCNVLQME